MLKKDRFISKVFLFLKKFYKVFIIFFVFYLFSAYIRTSSVNFINQGSEDLITFQLNHFFNFFLDFDMVTEPTYIFNFLFQYILVMVLFGNNLIESFFESDGTLCLRYGSRLKYFFYKVCELVFSLVLIVTINSFCNFILSVFQEKIVYSFNLISELLLLLLYFFLILLLTFLYTIFKNFYVSFCIIIFTVIFVLYYFKENSNQLFKTYNFNISRIFIYKIDFNSQEALSIVFILFLLNILLFGFITIKAKKHEFISK